MFHKIKKVSALPEYKLSVEFCEGVTKIYDVKPLLEKETFFATFMDRPKCSLPFRLMSEATE